MLSALCLLSVGAHCEGIGAPGSRIPLFMKKDVSSIGNSMHHRGAERSSLESIRISGPSSSALAVARSALSARRVDLWLARGHNVDDQVSRRSSVASVALPPLSRNTLGTVTVEANIAVAENIDCSVYSVIFRKVPGLQFGRSVPTRMVRLLADDRAAYLLISRSFVALAASGKKRAIGPIVLRQ